MGLFNMFIWINVNGAPKKFLLVWVLNMAAGKIFLRALEKSPVLCHHHSVIVDFSVFFSVKIHLILVLCSFSVLSFSGHMHASVLSAEIWLNFLDE